jgi:tetratricopeptide (TPR) repeat protein
MDPVIRRWKVRFILTSFAIAVSAAAVGGWWYARESTPHPGPIVLISVEGLRPADLEAYGGETGRAPAINALSDDAVVFERAYAHSPLSLPAHASILAGQLPFEHGVRDEAGFTLKDEARSLPELLRNRGFETGASVSSFLLRPESGVGQGFTFFNARIPNVAQATPLPEQDGMQVTEAAERWLSERRGHRFLLFIQVDQDAADSAVTRLVEQLKERDLYDQATIVLTSDRGAAGAGLSLDEAALRVPLLVKQPEREGAGRRIGSPVQHIDLLPTVLDLVRAPIPSGLRGRSLRPVLDGDEEPAGNEPIYAETLAGLFRFGGAGKFSLATPAYRYIRGHREEVVDLGSGLVWSPADMPGAAELRGELEGLIEGQPLHLPAELTAADEDHFAALGYLGGGLLFDTEPEPLEPDEEAWVVDTHRAAALLAGQKNYMGAIAHLRQIARAHPKMAVVQFQLGTLLARMDRFDEARAAFRAAADVEPDNPHVPTAVARLLLRGGQPEEAAAQAALAVALADHADSYARATAHRMAARVALASEDFDRAMIHAEASERDDPSMPMRSFVLGRRLYYDAEYDGALTAFEDAAARLTDDRHGIEDLHLYLGHTFARLERTADAEEQYRTELRIYPRNIAAYSSLAGLYQAADRIGDAGDVADLLVESVPTPEGYHAASGLWAALGDKARAAAIKADGRSRFRPVRSVARLAPGGQQ